MLWVVAGLVGLVTVAPAIDQALDPKKEAAGFAISRAADGQFYTEGEAGGVPLRMLVDPGAQTVLLSGPDAKRLGFEPGPGFTDVKLETLSVGPHVVRDVDAVIAPDLPVSLLGQSYLARLSSFEVDGNRMMLR